jgi:hypothetical protein
MTLRFEFDARKFEKDLRRAVEEGVGELAGRHATKTQVQVTETWNRLRQECRGMHPSEAECHVETAFRAIGVEFNDPSERAEWTTGILSDEELDLHVNIDVSWR